MIFLDNILTRLRYKADALSIILFYFNDELTHKKLASGIVHKEVADILCASEMYV